MTRKKEIIALFCILALGVFFRFYHITETPPGLYPDEAMNGSNALEALETGDFKLFYPENNGREGLFINIQALAVWLFGNDPWVLRSVSAFFGLLTILGVYLLAKELFFGQKVVFGTPLSGTLIALASSFFLATSYWHINFSRISFRAIMVPFFLSYSFYWLYKALRTGKYTSTILAGIFIGLGFHTYIAFRIVPLILFFVLGWELWKWYRKKHDLSVIQPRSCTPCAITLFLFITFITALPIGWYFLHNPKDFSGRSNTVSIFSAEKPAYEFVRSTVLTLGMFNVHGDCNERHNFRCMPELFWPVGILFIIGLCLSIQGLFRTTHDMRNPAIFLFSSFVFLMLPATLTREGLPHALRSIGMLVPAMLFAGIGASWLWQSINRFLSLRLSNPDYTNWHGQIMRIQRELKLFLFGFLAFLILSVFFTYHMRFANSKDAYLGFAVNITHIGNYLRQTPDSLPKYVIANGGGDPVRGIPISAEPIMFLTDTFTEKMQQEKNMHYILEDGFMNMLPEKTPFLLIPINFSRDMLTQLKTRYSIKPIVIEDYIILHVK